MLALSILVPTALAGVLGVKGRKPAISHFCNIITVITRLMLRKTVPSEPILEEFTHLMVVFNAT
jgi:hypothetical protein